MARGRAPVSGKAQAGAAASPARQARGRVAHVSGAMAEDNVSRLLEGKGMAVLARRWRGQAGEIDLICQHGDCLVFVEVKQSSTHQQAAQRLNAAQQGRILRGALEYCESQRHAPWPAMRFDVALVDQRGRVEILEAAFDEPCP